MITFSSIAKLKQKRWFRWYSTREGRAQAFTVFKHRYRNDNRFGVIGVKK